MADRIVTVDPEYFFPRPLEARLGAKIDTARTAAIADATAKINTVRTEASADATEKSDTAKTAAIADAKAKYGDLPARVALAEEDTFIRGGVPAGIDLNTLLVPGVYRSSTASGMINTPPGISANAAAMITVENARVTHDAYGPWAKQTMAVYGSDPQLWWRISRNTTGTWNAWERVGGPVSAPAPTPQPAGIVTPAMLTSRAVLVDAYKRRRGRTIGTGGLPAVALRFDHGMDKFKDIVLPLLEKHGLPWMQAMNSRMHTTASNASQNQNVTFPQVQQWCINTGGEVWNHSATHRDATTEGGLVDEIVTGLSELKAALPKLAIEGWAPPGVAAGGYMGYSSPNTPERHTDTLAGQLVLAHHAAIAGYVPGTFRTMPADLDIGATHITLDSATVRTLTSRLDDLQALPEPAALQLMVHPSLIGSDDSTLTAAILGEMLAEIAARRDAGKIVVLSSSGLLLADHRTDYRYEYLSNGSFDGFADWSSTDSWTVTGGVASTTTGTPMTSRWNFNGREHLRGATLELSYEVQATSGAVVAANVNGTDVGAARSVTLPASTGWVTVRKPFTVPLDFTGYLTATIGRVSGGPVNVRKASVHTI